MFSYFCLAKKGFAFKQTQYLFNSSVYSYTFSTICNLYQGWQHPKKPISAMVGQTNIKTCIECVVLLCDKTILTCLNQQLTGGPILITEKLRFIFFIGFLKFDCCSSIIEFISRCSVRFAPYICDIAEIPFPLCRCFP